MKPQAGVDMTSPASSELQHTHRSTVPLRRLWARLWGRKRGGGREAERWQVPAMRVNVRVRVRAGQQWMVGLTRQQPLGNRQQRIRPLPFFPSCIPFLPSPPPYPATWPAHLLSSSAVRPDTEAHRVMLSATRSAGVLPGCNVALAPDVTAADTAAAALAYTSADVSPDATALAAASAAAAAMLPMYT